MAQQFGKTWWGENFLQALTDIDYSNRLPRGRSYARNGSVAEIKTTNNRINAKVKGSRRTPYKVEIILPLFSGTEKKKLIQAITDDPLVLSHLLNRELPHELNVIAQKHKIAVFPKKWSDFDMNCSCPDWAVPCKHLASVIYMLSAEIDRNPFLVFQLHGLDILKELTKVGMTLNKEMSISSFDQLFLDKPLAVVDENNVNDNHFDLYKVHLSVVVMKMVRSDIGASGVMFSLDTETGFSDVVFINAALGLGENVVQGTIDPDSFYVHKPTFVEGYRAVLKRRLDPEVQIEGVDPPAPVIPR